MSPGLRRVAVVGSLIAVAATVVTVVALTQDGGDAGSSVSPSAPAAATSASTTTPYCETARAALMYEGTDTAERTALLDRVVDAAPDEVASTVRRVRGARPGTAGYTRAKHLWDYYNNTHCCQCIGALSAPEISELTPGQRLRVEAGKSIAKR